MVLLVLVLAACAAFGSDRRAVPAAVFVFLVGVHFASVFEIPAGRFRWIGAGVSALVLAPFAWERFERFELLGEIDRVGALAEWHDAKVAEYNARKGGMSKEELEAAEGSLRRSRADFESSLQRFRARAQELNTLESVLGFASIGGLLLHSLLAAKARRAALA
jgi:hypothetical protein